MGFPWLLIQLSYKTTFLNKVVLNVISVVSLIKQKKKRDFFFLTGTGNKKDVSVIEQICLSHFCFMSKYIPLIWKGTKWAVQLGCFAHLFNQHVAELTWVTHQAMQLYTCIKQSISVSDLPCCLILNCLELLLLITFINTIAN